MQLHFRGHKQIRRPGKGKLPFGKSTKAQRAAISAAE